ncbi:hypothetical protein CPB84DRAFT_1796914 [Gymnopilus junonius]|uniref:Uncharacterized protein n=1 Tax=Gymnopilus junonius TaxID=109634 RepID=A0A9P5N8T9_GYMJU|nr:hypothetical protein CPB84DRAFT_1796914 [Gymnopilus junonius]
MGCKTYIPHGADKPSFEVKYNLVSWLDFLVLLLFTLTLFKAIAMDAALAAKLDNGSAELNSWIEKKDAVAWALMVTVGRDVLVSILCFHLTAPDNIPKYYALFRKKFVIFLRRISNISLETAWDLALKACAMVAHSIQPNRVRRP